MLSRAFAPSSQTWKWGGAARASHPWSPDGQDHCLCDERIVPLVAQNLLHHGPPVKGASGAVSSLSNLSSFAFTKG